MSPIEDSTRVLSTPNATEREATARMRRSLDQYANCSPEAISKGSEAQMRYFVADAKHDIAILAVRLDEAAIRKDEREKCAKIADAARDNSDEASNPYDGGSGSLGYEAACDDIASAIRNGGKQP